MSQAITNVVENMLQPFLEEQQFELVAIDYVKENGNRFLRVYVDKEGGIDIDDCAKISEFLSAQLDGQDPIKEAYFLEVSSPGAERPLKKEADFVKAIGSHVYVKTHAAVDKRHEFEGELLLVEEDELTIQIGKRKVVIPRNVITEARLAVVF